MTHLLPIYYLRDEICYLSAPRRTVKTSSNRHPFAENRQMKIANRQIPKQTAIAAVLTDMDSELAVMEQRQAKTRALKQSMMQSPLTGRTGKRIATALKTIP